MYLPPISGCWHLKVMKNQSCGVSSVSSCHFCDWTDNFIFLNLPSLSVKEDNNACPNPVISCLAVYKCFLLWEMVNVAQRKLCQLSIEERKQPLCQWKCCIPFDSLESTQWAPRDTRRDSRAEQASLLPLEMNACLPGCVWNATPRSLSPLERNIGFWTQA